MRKFAIVRKSCSRPSSAGTSLYTSSREAASAQGRCHLLQVPSPRCWFHPGVRVDAFQSSEFVLGSLLVSLVPATVLFDSGASHSFKAPLYLILFFLNLCLQPRSYLVPSYLIHSYLSPLFQSMAFIPIFFVHRLHLILWFCRFIYLSVPIWIHNHDVWFLRRSSNFHESHGYLSKNGLTSSSSSFLTLFVWSSVAEVKL